MAFKNWCLNNVARPRPAQAFVPQIDGLRFLAIGAVVLYHVQGYVAINAGVPDSGWLFKLLRQGHFGVPLFFALSGYIIACQFLGPGPVELRRYFIRRLTRLEPPYLISMGLIFIAKLWALDFAFPDFFLHLLASLVYAHNIIFATHSTVNGVAWSLEIEWQFYVLAPLVFAAVVRMPGPARHAGLWLLMLVGGFAHAFALDLGPRFGLSLLRYFGFFVAGAWVAVLEEQSAEKSVASRFDLLGVVSFFAIITILISGGLAQMALPALTALIVLCTLRGPKLRLIFGWWPVHCIGAMCYTVYLYHFFIVSAVGWVYASTIGWSESPDASLVGFMLIAFPVVVLVCLIPYLVIERPFMAWRPGTNRLLDSFRPQPT